MPRKETEQEYVDANFSNEEAIKYAIANGQITPEAAGLSEAKLEKEEAEKLKEPTDSEKTNEPNKASGSASSNPNRHVNTVTPPTTNVTELANDKETESSKK